MPARLLLSCLLLGSSWLAVEGGRQAPPQCWIAGADRQHWVTATEDGIRVTDVWPSREEFVRFAAEQIGPFTAKVRFPAAREITFHDVHNYDSAEGTV